MAKRDVVAVFASILSAFVGLWLTAAPALAAPYTPAPIQLNVSTPAPGAPITIVAEGYRPGSTVTILIYSEPVKLGSAIADANGRISATVTVPSTFAPGSDHTIEAQGIRPDGAPLTRSVHVALAAPDATGGSLASTGVRVAEMTGLGVAIIGTGWLILMMTRRRRNLTTTPRV